MNRLLLPLLAVAMAGCASSSEPPANSPTTTTTQTTTTTTTVVPAGTAPTGPTGVTAPAGNQGAATKSNGSGADNTPAEDRRLRARITNAARKPYDQLLVCYRDAIRRDKTTNGTVSINITVAPSGEPVVIQDAGSTVKDRDFVTCVQASLSKAAYPRWQGKAVTVVVNYDFTREVADPPVPEE